MKQLFLLLAFICKLSLLQAQLTGLVYTDARKLALIGQAFPLAHSYHRIDTAAYPTFPPAVKNCI